MVHRSIHAVFHGGSPRQTRLIFLRLLVREDHLLLGQVRKQLVEPLGLMLLSVRSVAAVQLRCTSPHLLFLEDRRQKVLHALLLDPADHGPVLQVTAQLIELRLPRFPFIGVRVAKRACVVRIDASRGLLQGLRSMNQC